MFDLKLTKDQEQLLRDQVIDPNRPGAILRDATTVLDFIGPAGLKSAGKYNLLPLDSIPELDACLSRPLRLALKRPQLRSHPYLQGLHLVLRSSGLLCVAGSGEKARLVVPEVTRERWRQLNPTEQYFALLQAWLVFGRSEMVGDGESRFDGFLTKCLGAWQRLPAKKLRADRARPAPLWLPGISGEQYHLALMDLFGLIRVGHPTKPVQPWSPISLEHEPFGDAVFTVLMENRLDDWIRSREDEEETWGFGRWQPYFQPYFPEWRANWIVSDVPTREGIFVFRVAINRGVWRLIAIDSEDTLDDLMDCILASINFDSDHLYEFSYRDSFGATARAVGPRSDGELGTDEVQIGDLPLEPGRSMDVTYDFGDTWRFTIVLERIEAPGKRRMKPRILERHGKSPKQYDWD